MLKHRIIPIVLIDGFSVLKTMNFERRRNLGSPITVMQTYETRNVDELIILDIDATKQNRSIDKFVIKEMTQESFMPLTIGGGLRDCKDIEGILNVGADKVSLNSSIVADKNFLSEAVRNFGSQCIVVSIDVMNHEGNLKLFCDGKVNDKVDIFDHIKSVEESGAGELLVTDVSREGTMMGINVKMASLISSNSSVPLIFAGGTSSPVDAAKLIKKTGISGVGLSSIFHFTDFTPEDCRIAFRKENIPVRQNV